MRGVPEEYVSWLRTKLSGRKTRLKFDDYTTALFDIISGIDQGCPLSVILYAFYNSDLIDKGCSILRARIADNSNPTQFALGESSHQWR